MRQSQPAETLENRAEARDPTGWDFDFAEDFETGSNPLAPGHGYARGHHGEVLQGLFEGSDGHFHRGLVTLPCERLWSAASFLPLPAGLTVDPPWKTKALRAVRLTLEHLGRPASGGRLSIRANIPPSWGMGSSTSDVIAAVRAVSNAYRRRLSPDVVASLAVRAEDASDSTMFEDRTVLFAQREGVVLEELGRQLPPVDVLGFNCDPLGGGVDTLLTPPAEYSSWHLQAFRPLLGLLRRAVYTHDIQLLGQVASASARINQSFFPKPNFGRLEKLAAEVGAAGLQVAHTGSILGFLFDPAESGLREKISATRRGLLELEIRQVWHFSRTGVRALGPDHVDDAQAG
jgi:uncharacterized protein involved in propanediol utilization